uniref:Uncharacterized protein n=1 Tax=Utricularia reniformis TaxID=192314 RepID=A0A1Y0B1G2_9LAMI|nr:hypothetical protein AEK19_MT1063 [Utricularia reniformis]ART31285.1 hypothetical protein AEK19_MT1063 [Utricularia reniformis]
MAPAPSSLITSSGTAHTKKAATQLLAQRPRTSKKQQRQGQGLLALNW